MSGIRLLIADDHTVLRTGLKMLLNAQYDIEPVVQASKEEVQALAAYIESLKPGTALAPIALPVTAEGSKEASIAEGETLYQAWIARRKPDSRRRQQSAPGNQF